MLKKILLIITLSTALSVPISIFAKSENANENAPGQNRASASPTATASASANNDVTGGAKNWQEKYNQYKQASDDKKAENLQSLGEIFIDNRIQLLTQLKTRIQAMTTIEATVRDSLISEIDKLIVEMNSLKGNIQNRGELQELKKQVQAIFQNFHVYSVSAPKMLGESLVAQGKYILGRLEAIQRQLQIMLDQNKNAGKDVSAIQPLIDQLNAKLTDAKVQLAIAEEKFKSMTPANTDVAKTAREEGKAAFRQAKEDLKAAHDILKEIFNKLKALEATSPTPTTSSSPSSAAPVSPSPSPVFSATPTPQESETP